MTDKKELAEIAFAVWVEATTRDVKELDLHEMAMLGNIARRTRDLITDYNANDAPRAERIKFMYTYGPHIHEVQYHETF